MEYDGDLLSPRILKGLSLSSWSWLLPDLPLGGRREGTPGGWEEPGEQPWRWGVGVGSGGRHGRSSSRDSPPSEPGARLTIHSVQVPVLLETAVVLVFLPTDVTRVPEIVCGGWKDTSSYQGFGHVGWGWGGRSSSALGTNMGPAHTSPNWCPLDSQSWDC